MARRLYTVSWLCSFSGEAHNRAHLCLGGVSQLSIQSAADDECRAEKLQRHHPFFRTMAERSTAERGSIYPHTATDCAGSFPMDEK